MSFGLMALSIAAQAYSQNQSTEASNKQVKAQEDSREIDQRMASIENQRNKRKAIAQQQVERSKLIAASAVDNSAGSSAVQGALAGNEANMAGQIGFANTRLGAAASSGAVLQRGNNQAAALNSQAGWLATAGAVFGAGQAYQDRRSL